MFVSATAPTTGQFLVACTLASFAATAVAVHANKVGSRPATAWGVEVFPLLGLILPVYVMHARRAKHERRRY